MLRPLKTPQIVVDVSVAAGFALITLPIEIGVAQGTLDVAPLLLSAVVITLLFATGLAVRRAAPGLALALVWGGALVQVALGRPPSAVDVAIFGVLYATAAYGGRLVFWLGFASTFAGAAIISAYLVIGPDFVLSGLSWSSIPILFAVLIAATFALGLAWTSGALVRTALRARANREAQKRAEADAAVEQERVRIARDMHDVVAHSLAVIIAQADGARYASRAAASAASASMPARPATPLAPGSTEVAGGERASPDMLAAQALVTISTTARAALADVRVLLEQLRHQQDAGPQPALVDLESLYSQVRAAGVDLQVDVDPAPIGEPPAAVQLAVYRILQEALTNALRHGRGAGGGGGGGAGHAAADDAGSDPEGVGRRAVSVSLAWHPDRVDLVVINPIGSPRAKPAGPERVGPDRVGSERAGSDRPGTERVGHGIIGMRERAQLAGGHLDAASEGDVFTVRGTIPIGGAV